MRKFLPAKASTEPLKIDPRGPLARTLGWMVLVFCLPFPARAEAPPALTPAPLAATDPPADASADPRVQDVPAESAQADEAGAADTTEPASAAEDSESTSLPAGHSSHGEAFNEGPRQAAYRMQGTGIVHFPVQSPHADVQAFIDQGVGQLHGFWYFEAERSFRQAAALDPDCAAAYWGMAMANANNRERATKFAEQAMERIEHASPRVQHYIKALAKLLKAKDAQQGSDDYLHDLEAIVYEFPEDIEAKAFIALHLWEGRRNEQKIRSFLAVDALIGQVLEVQPMHPVHHYRIHLWDYEKPERALESAARCGQAAPAIAHMWHMPGHIYSRLKRYPDAVWQQEASARTDHAQMMHDQLLPDQIHNFAHNNEWLIRDLIFVGRIHDALDLAQNMIQLPRHPKYNLLSKSGTSSHYGRMRLLQVLSEGELWEETLRLANTPVLPRTDDFLSQLEWLRAVARANFHLGRTDAGQTLRGDVETLLNDKRAEQERLGAEARTAAVAENKSAEETEKEVKKAQRRLDGDIRRAERGLNEIDAYLAASREDWAQAIELLKKASDYEKFELAQFQMRAGKPDEALELLTKQVKSHENEVLPLAQLAYVQWQAGQLDQARQTMQQLRERSAYLDPDVAPFARLAPLVAQLDWPRDYRVAAQAAPDVGQRPPLDSLGPFRWEPTPAPSWSLPGARGEQLALDNYRGQPVVVIFYLGWGCLHCAEQLHAFGPQYQAFRDAGIELVAISSDDAEGLQKSLANYDGGDIPFPLLADPQLEIFRQYRVFDDFEDQPLHGTFLIDGEGRIRWHDISFEPFMDVAFVLEESKRLLAQ